MSNKQITIEQLTKDFGHGRGIFDINLYVRRGEVLGFLGPNGAGKTTTIRHLMGFTKPGKGRAEISGLNATTQYQRVMENVGYLPGEVALPEEMNGRSFIKMMQQMRKIDDDSHIRKLLTQFELDPNMPIKKMSLGMKRKLAVVVALMADPDVLILDEPTSGLDPSMQDQFISFMVGEKNRGKTILLSSHIFREVEALCDRIVIIKDGHIVSEVDANQLKNADEKNFKLVFVDAAAASKAHQQLGGQLKEAELNIKVKRSQLTKFFKNLGRYSVVSITEQRFDLEKYFLHFYRTDRKFQTL